MYFHELKSPRIFRRIFLATFFSVVLFCTGSGCDKEDQAMKALEERLQKLEAGAPGVGTVMSGVQLHFAKLYFAGEAQNWPLVEFELHEVEENLDIAVMLRPEENGTNLIGLNAAFKQTQLAALKTASQNNDWNAFQSIYTEAIGVCNGCHQETGRPFIVVTVPAAPPVPNQQWQPAIQSSEK